MTLDVNKLHFIDEFGIYTDMSRDYARAPKGARAEVTEPFHIDSKVSVIGALSMRRLGATMTVEGAVDGAVFTEYVKQVLRPELGDGDIVLMDNIKFHHNPNTIQLIESTGARVIHLPAYSPDFNPIEECISKLKNAIRQAKPGTRRKLENELKRAINSITSQDICNWFTHSGYTCSFN